MLSETDSRWIRFKRNLASGGKRAAWSAIWACVIALPSIYFWMPNSKGILIGLVSGVAPLALTALFLLYPRSVIGTATSSFATTIFFLTYVFFRALPETSNSAFAIVAHVSEWSWYGIGFGIIWGGGEKLGNRTHWIVGLVPLIAAILFESGRGFNRFGKLGLLTSVAILGGYALGYFLSFWFNQCLEYMAQVWNDVREYRWQILTFISGYVLLVWIFAGLFGMMWQLKAVQITFKDKPEFADFIFFSFSNVSTLGFSEIKPANVLARTLTSIEVLAGIFWVTVVFTRLSELAQKRQERRQVALLKNIAQLETSRGTED